MWAGASGGDPPSGVPLTETGDDSDSDGSDDDVDVDAANVNVADTVVDDFVGIVAAADLAAEGGAEDGSELVSHNDDDVDLGGGTEQVGSEDDSDADDVDAEVPLAPAAAVVHKGSPRPTVPVITGSTKAKTIQALAPKPAQEGVPHDYVDQNLSEELNQSVATMISTAYFYQERMRLR